MTNTQTTKHTPGPWTIDEPGSRLITFHGIPVAKALDNCDTKEEIQANARLIAAAPDMLEELKDAVDYLSRRREELAQAGVDYKHLTTRIARYNAAIAKAEGK